jgi:hypothetical protein
MSSGSYSHPTGWRILRFGRHSEIAAAVEGKLRSLGFQAANLVLTNDEAGDARLVAELRRAEYDGVAIGGYINGQDAGNFPATEETTVWLNRVSTSSTRTRQDRRSSSCAARRMLSRRSNESSERTRPLEQTLAGAVASGSAGVPRPSLEIE